MQSELNDIELIRSVLLDNNTAAYGKLMNRYTIQVYNAAIRLVNDEDEASDVTQQAFIQAYRQLDSWRGGSFGAWVVIIANHIALRMLEKEKRRPTVPLDDNTDTPDDTYDERKEKRLQTMETAIERLPDEERRIIKWHYYEKISLKDISTRLGHSESNIKVRIFRIREKLKTIIQNEEDE
ncbi:MAG: sigma-70 family RNA polymerase sigma factor [Bacteroidales bacterium]|jgi:RNA polymerase sigma-70 factor (ECF subfamily)|nr:sigma-70 family RNA polymerase sigma factor [Bacteroidales bacterium]